MKNPVQLRLPAILLFTFSIVFIACQKDDIVPPEVEAGIKDSTLLIKSIQFIDNANDTTGEYYNYDSINKKVTLTWKGEYADRWASMDLKYNSNGYLIGSEIHFAIGFVPEPYDISGSIITYDAENVVKTITQKLVGQPSIVTNFTKTPAPEGYQLSWEVNQDYTNYETFICKAVFNNKGVLIYDESPRSFEYADDTLYNAVIFRDSIAYDAQGNANNFRQTRIDTFRHTVTNTTTASFTSRETRGDNFYNQRQLLLKGVANVPLDQIEQPFSGFWGLLSIYPGEDYNFQFYKFPLKSASLYNYYSEKIETFTANSVVDAKNRLIKFDQFDQDYYGPEKIEILITYYK